MIILVAVGLVVVDAIILSSLRSYLYGRVDAQLTTASAQVARYVLRAEDLGFPVTATGIQSRVSSDIYVMIIDSSGKVVIVQPSESKQQADPPPRLPVPLPTEPVVDTPTVRSDSAYRPDSASFDVPSTVRDGPTYRMQASTLADQTLVVATRLDSVNSTLASLRTTELVVSIGLLVVLLVMINILTRLGLRPLEDMTKEADAIAAGDLTRRVQPTEGNGEIPRLGRALNGMLSQIEHAFSERTRSEERLRSFLADASHELRTPLTAIRGYAELLQKDALGDPAANARALSRIEAEAARMGVLVGDLAVLAREGEGTEPPRRRVDLVAVAAEAVADARAMDPHRPIDLSAPTEAMVAADSPRLGQLVANLVTNGLRHTPPGTPVEVRIQIRGDRTVLQVRDYGPGMTDEQASRVFDRFYRGDAERLDGGSGLGLFIVASLARTFGGSASVRTAPGRGATFEVILPCYGSEPLPSDPSVRSDRSDGSESPSSVAAAPSLTASSGPTDGSAPVGASTDAVPIDRGHGPSPQESMPSPGNRSPDPEPAESDDRDHDAFLA
jgi:two-component system OmpR family sensor kinase